MKYAKNKKAYPIHRKKFTDTIPEKIQTLNLRGKDLVNYIKCT